MNRHMTGIAVILTAGLLALPAKASAEDSCLHRSDFREVAQSALSDTPMSRWHVHQIFGTTGDDAGYNTRVYQGCGEGSRAWVGYEQDSEGTYRATSTAFTWTYFGDGLTTEHPA